MFVDRWQKECDNHLDCKISKLLMPTVSDTKVSCKMKVGELQKLSQIVTGHGLFKSHLNHWNDIYDTGCSLCWEAKEDAWQLWMYCPTLGAERAQINAEMTNGLPWDRALLKLFHCPKIKELVASNEAIIEPG